MASDYIAEHLMAGFDGVFQPYRAVRSAEESRPVILYTSIPPLTKRQALGEEIGSDYQAECLRSWKGAGFEIFSLNQPIEIESLASIYPDVSFLPVETRRPKIIDFLSRIASSGVEVGGIVNADCFFLGTSQSVESITEHARGAMIMLERLNFSPESLRATGKSCFGFDAFIFDTKFLSSLKMNEDISIGETWWDYWFPLAFKRAGGVLKTSQSPLMFHLDHVQGWSWEQYNSNGLKLYQEFKSMDWVLPAELQTPQGELIVGEFAYFCFDWIKSVAPAMEFRGGSISEKIAAAFWTGVSGFAFEAEIAKEDARSVYIEARLHGVANQQLGETLCTLSQPFKQLPVVGPTAAKLYKIGEDMQFRASRRDAEWQMENAFIKEFFDNKNLEFLLVMPTHFGQFFHHFRWVKNVICVDTSESGLKSTSSFVRPGPPDASTNFKNGDLMDFQFPNILFDVAIVQLYGFVPQPMLPYVIKELCRITKSDILVRNNNISRTRNLRLKYENCSYNAIEDYFKDNRFDKMTGDQSQKYEGISIFHRA